MGEARRLLDLNGRAVPLRIRRDKRAKRLTLRIDQSAEGAVVTIPDLASDDEATAFARGKGDWIIDQLARLPERMPFVDGALVPVLGHPHRIRHLAGERGGVWRENDEIRVTGDTAHLARRVTDWLKKEARLEIVHRAAAKSDQLGLPHGRITLRDTRSRWGSCAANGNLSFCWRLILAPEPVLDYVVAHEIAHLSIRDHSPAFHALVAELTDSAVEGRVWLREQGHTLRRYG